MQVLPITLAAKHPITPKVWQGIWKDRVRGKARMQVLRVLARKQMRSRRSGQQMGRMLSFSSSRRQPWRRICALRASTMHISACTPRTHPRVTGRVAVSTLLLQMPAPSGLWHPSRLHKIGVRQAQTLNHFRQDSKVIVHTFVA